MPKKRSIALLVPALSLGGGVPAVATFLYQVISNSGRYRPEIISLATSSRDRDSIRLLSPSSWLKGVQLSTGEWQGLLYRHVGAVFTEIEFQHYRPRRILTELLRRYDLVQIIAGTPAWAWVANEVRLPVCLFTATTTQLERVSMIEQARGWRRRWLMAMTHINARIEKKALSYVSYTFAESEYTRQVLSSRVRPERLALGVPGVDTCLFHPASYQQDGHILSVGRSTDPRKNIRLLFEAYHRLRQAASQVPKLVLVGEAPAKQDWDYAISLEVAEWIDVYQGVSRQELADLYRGASLFILASNEEGLGVVILEAMASGIPVISTDCGGPATAIVEGQTGCLTPVGDSAAMATKMQELLAQPFLRKSMGEVGKRVVDERFSLAAAGRIYLDKYDELLATS